jgi:hypothetical protein
VSGLTASTQYTFNVKAKDAANNVASGASITVTTSAPVDTTAPVLTITPAATFTDTQTVNMSTNETATIWYTLDDTDPTTSGTKLQYTAPLTLTATDTIKAYAVDSANNASAVQTVTYTKQTSTYQYLQLAGGTSKVNIPSSTSLQLTNNFSIAIKFAYDADSSTATGLTLIDKSSAEYQVAWNGTTHKGKFYGVPASGTIPSYTLAEVLIADNDPHTLEYQYDGTTFKALLDGVQKTSGASTFTLAQAANAINVMTGIKGRLYSLKIVKAGVTVLDIDCTKGTVADQSGNNNNGTITGGTFVA